MSKTQGTHVISIVESNSVIREHVTVEEKRVISSDTEYSIVKKLLFSFENSV